MFNLVVLMDMNGLRSDIFIMVQKAFRPKDGEIGCLLPRGHGLNVMLGLW